MLDKNEKAGQRSGVSDTRTVPVRCLALLDVGDSVVNTVTSLSSGICMGWETEIIRSVCSVTAGICARR